MSGHSNGDYLKKVKKQQYYIAIVIILVCFLSAWALLPKIDFQPRGMVYAFVPSAYEPTPVSQMRMCSNVNTHLPTSKVIGVFTLEHAMAGANESILMAMQEKAFAMGAGIGGMCILLSGEFMKRNSYYWEGAVLVY